MILYVESSYLLDFCWKNVIEAYTSTFSKIVKEWSRLQWSLKRLKIERNAL